MEIIIFESRLVAFVAVDLCINYLAAIGLRMLYHFIKNRIVVGTKDGLHQCVGYRLCGTIVIAKLNQQQKKGDEYPVHGRKLLLNCYWASLLKQYNVLIVNYT